MSRVNPIHTYIYISIGLTWRGGSYGLAFTRYCHYQYCVVYGIHKGGRGGVVYCAIDVE